MKLKECKTPEEYRKYAMCKDNITDEEIQLCLNMQIPFSKSLSDEDIKRRPIEEQKYLLRIDKSMCDLKTTIGHFDFARYVPNLTTDQIQQCLDKMVTLKDYCKFLTYVPNLTKKQKNQCLRKISTLGITKLNKLFKLRR